MQFVCDAPDGKTWFRIETEGEAALESRAMNHAVERYFVRHRDQASQSFKPARPNSIEHYIGREAHILRAMPIYLTLRDREGNGLATAMLPPGGREDPMFQIVVVGPGNSDPYPANEQAIRALGAYYGIRLGRERCFPYGRRGV
jgi:hypothetical protein